MYDIFTPKQFSLLIFLPLTVSANLSTGYDSVSEWNVEKILLLLSTIHDALLPKVAKSIKKKCVSQISIPVDKNGEKKDMKTCAWRYITFSVAYDYFVSCFVLTLNRSSELAPALNIW